MFPNENTRYVTDAGWGMGQDFLILDTGEMPVNEDEDSYSETDPDEVVDGYIYQDRLERSQEITRE